MAPSDKTALQCVMEVDAERVRLEHEAEQLTTMNSDGTFYVSAHYLLHHSSAFSTVGFKPYLDDQLVSFSALTLLVWSSGL